MKVPVAAWVVALALNGPAAARVADPQAYEWQQHPGRPIPAVALRDDAGTSLSSSALFAGRPVVLDLGYFRCPSLCGLVRGNLLHALARSGLRAGRDYDMAILSIDPGEMPQDAANARRRDASQFPEAAHPDWRYLTGDAGAVKAIADAVGFRAELDPRLRDFIHPTGIVLLTGAGTISSYLLGGGFAPGDVRAAIARARDGGIAHAALPVLLLCFHYDEATGRYTLAIFKMLRLLGVLTVLTLGGLFFVLSRQSRAGQA